MTLLPMRVCVCNISLDVIVGQLFLSMESLLSILKSLMGLNFPFDFFSSFSPSFLNSEERQSDAVKTQVTAFETVQ